MGNILKFKTFEAIYLGKINIKDYRFIYSDRLGTGIFELTNSDDQKFDIEIKPNGKSKDMKFTEFRLFSPENENNYDFKEVIDKLVYILNKNELGYKFKIKEVQKPKYGLQPYALITSNKELEMVEMEKLSSSTKPTKKMVKKKGGFDQFTF
jgi:hypothetical protein